MFRNKKKGPKVLDFPKSVRGVGRPTLLDERTKQLIVNSIVAGAWDWVACEAAGVGNSTFRRWMSLGAKDEEAGIDSEFRAFRAEVRQAHAQARMAAEISVNTDSPLSWLRLGPGRQRPGEAGWSEHTELAGSGGEEIVVKLKFADTAGIPDKE